MKKLKLKNCKECTNEYDQKEIERIYGKLSGPAIYGYCSAKCFTKSLTHIPYLPSSNYLDPKA